jgi:serine/threonine protein kinase
MGIEEAEMPAKEKKKKTSSVAAPAASTVKVAPLTCPNCRTENPSGSRFCHNCATPLQESLTKTVKSPTFEITRGDLFAGRYEIIESLGQGGMGKVFKVFDRTINEIVALKLIRPEISVNDRAIDRFKNELKVARKITHRNVCRMHDLGAEGFYSYITMEYVAGEDLKRFIRRAGTLSPGKAVRIAKQVVEGLIEAHHLGVIHRDLKPQNIMIDQDGNAKIMDFGIARFVDTERLTGSGVMIGTPEYMSPEQVDLREVDGRADVYSLGIVIYEMVSGRVPFEGETALAVAMKHKTEKPRDVRELNAQVSPELAGIISNCLEKAPESRYQTGEELLEDLSRVEKELTTTERPAPKKTPPGTRLVSGRFPLKKLLVPAAILVFAAIAVVAVLKFLPRKEAAPPVPAEQTQAKTTQPEAQPPSALPQEKTKAEDQKPRPEETAAQAAAKKETPKVAPKPAQPAAPEPDMSSANVAMARVTAARSQVLKAGIAESDLFFQLAEEQEKQGQKYLAQKSPLEARSQFFVSERLLRICLEKSKDEDRLQVLKRAVESLRNDLEEKRAFARDDALYGAAKENEKQAVLALSGRDILNAARSYIKAYVIYEKFRLSLAAPGNK